MIRRPRPVRRRLIAGLLLGLALAAGLTAALAGKSARAVERDLAAAQRLMSRAADRDPSLESRTANLGRAHDKIDAARQELTSFPLRQFGAVPLLGRDVRVAQAVSTGADDIVTAAQNVLTVTTVTGRAANNSAQVVAASAALTKLTATVRRGADSVRASRPLFLTGLARERFLIAAATEERDLERLSQAAKLLSSFYDTKAPKAYFVGFQNPAESRGTGGLIGVFGVMVSSASGPVLREAGPIESLQMPNGRLTAIAQSLRDRYKPFGFDGDWREANLPPDLPTVGPVLVDMYQRARGKPLQGVIMLDPIGSAEILRVAGSITVDGQRLDATNLAQALMIEAYVRYQGDSFGRKKFLTDAARKVLQATNVSAARKPLDLLRALRTAVLERHLQAYSSDPDAQRALLSLGMAGNGAAPADGDYLMPVGINTAGNKLDAFLRRKVSYDVRLRADGGASTTATVSLYNAIGRARLPQTVIGPFDRRFKAGENRQFLELYVAHEYGLSSATVDGRRTLVHALDNLDSLMLGSEVSIPAKRSATIEYRLERRNAVRLEGDRLKYRLLVRPQPQVRPGQLVVSITPPHGWKFIGLPSGFDLSHTTAVWSGTLDRERAFDFDMEFENAPR
jgi:Protein of unknown function (DUF4012)